MLVKSFFIPSVSLRNPLSRRTNFCRRFNSIRSEDVLVFFIAESISGSNRNVILSPKWMKAPFRGLGLFYTDSLHQLCFQLKKDFYIQFAILSSTVTWRDGSRQFVSFICWRPVLCLFYSDGEGSGRGVREGEIISAFMNRTYMTPGGGFTNCWKHCFSNHGHWRVK